MKEDLMFCVVFGLGLGAVALLAFVGAKTSDLIDKIVTKRREKEHPELFRLIYLCNAMGNDMCQEHNATVPHLIKRIDRLVAELKYLPADQVEERTIELESLRQDLYKAKREYDKKQDELDEVRCKVRAYVREHNLKWAMKWGW